MGSAIALSSDNDEADADDASNNDDTKKYRHTGHDRYMSGLLDKLQSSLLRSSRRGDIDKIKRILNKGIKINVDVTDGAANTPLFIAAKEGHAEVMQILLQFGANVEGTRDASCGWTPLWIATFSGHSQCVQILIEAGANIETNSPETPLLIAAREDQADCMKLLIDAGAKLGVCNASRQSPLHLAAEECNIECVNVLLKYYVNVNATDKYNRTPLHLICNNTKPEAIECILLFVQYELQVDLADIHGKTPLHISASLGDFDVIQLLLELGSSPKFLDKSGKRPSDLASCHAKALKLLYNAENIPMPLTSLCRLRIRKLSSSKLDLIERLPLPPKLIRFLNFTSWAARPMEIYS